MSAKKYSFQRETDGEWYSVDFYAKDLTEAKSIMKLLGGKRLVMAQEVQVVCSDCLNQLVCLECEDLKEGFLPPEIPCYQN